MYVDILVCNDIAITQETMKKLIMNCKYLRLSLKLRWAHWKQIWSQSVRCVTLLTRLDFIMNTKLSLKKVCVSSIL